MSAGDGNRSYQPLPKIYKGRYPFRLSVPSFVYPDTWSINARMLAPHVDEIELLFFESKTEGCLPSREEIDALCRISKDFSLGYNIHLPTDVSLVAPGKADRSKALDALLKTIDLTSELEPTGWTLHIPSDFNERNDTDIKRWQERACKGLGKLLASGIPSRRLAVENLDYPFEQVRDIVRELDLGICMDGGHLLLRREDIAAFYSENADRITILHLHGVRGGKDHLPLTVCSKTDGLTIANILNVFSGTVSVEVFSYDQLSASLGWMDGAVKAEVRRLGRAEER